MMHYPHYLAILAALASSLSPISSSAADPTTMVYVANAENQTVPQVRYTGREWKVNQAGYLEGVGKGHRLLGLSAPGEGDFRISLELALGHPSRESSVVLDGTSEIVMRAGAGAWALRGRFFRAGESEIALPSPKAAVHAQFNLVVERKGTQVQIFVAGRPLYTGVCGGEALSALGLDPGPGGMRLYNFEASGNFAADAGGKIFDNAFGMQLEPRPATARAVRAPAIVREAPTNECSVVTHQDGTIAVYFVTKPESESISVIESKDGGLTWTEPAVAFTIPGRAYYAVKVATNARGDLHAVFHLLGQGEGGYRGRLYEVYHTAKKAGAASWSKPQRVVPGYVGSIRGLIVTTKGRLLLGVGKAIPEREKTPTSGPDYGWNDTFVYYSDDGGTTWTQSPDVLQVELITEFATRYGAIEPALVELLDGRVWMLVRDRGGRLWESYSADGARWSPLEKTKFISSDSPAELLRLRDGRLVLFVNACQNWADPRSYAVGGREVLQAAISADDGKTWSGFREVLHETNLVGGGDRGTAYPSATESADGNVVLVSGQGHGKHAIVVFNPDWLAETTVVDRLEVGPVAWTQYGDERLHVAKDDAGAPVVAIPLKSSGLCGASWNFPLGNAGELKLRLWIPRGVESLSLALNDHFTRVDDSQAAANAVYRVRLRHTGGEPGWHDVRLRWQEAIGRGDLSVQFDGAAPSSVKAQRPAVLGVNYLRVEFRSTRDEDSVRLGHVTVTVQN